MDDSIIAYRAKEQLTKFLGKVFTHFHKPTQRFIGEMLYGIQASGDTKLSSVVRAIDDDIKPIMTEKRLSRNLDDEKLESLISDAILNEGVRHVKKDTLILVDPTEIKKEYGFRMEHISCVRDASRSSKEGKDVLVNGYHGCMAVACQNGGRKTIPLALKLWSSRIPEYKSENDEVIKIIDSIMAATNRKGILVYDRGGDRPPFYEHFIKTGYDFIIRMNRKILISWRGHWSNEILASQCNMKFNHYIDFDSHGKECRVQLQFGSMPVRLPFLPDNELTMVVVKGFGKSPMMLLTSLPVVNSFESVWQVVNGYISRWRIEETIRFVKQSYGFENLRVMTYTRIKNMASLVLATTYFSTAWIGRTIKKSILAEHLKEMSKRLDEKPGITTYALADGIRHAFTHGTKWVVNKVKNFMPSIEPEPIFNFLPGAEIWFDSGGD